VSLHSRHSRQSMRSRQRRSRTGPRAAPRQHPGTAAAGGQDCNESTQPPTHLSAHPGAAASKVHPSRTQQRPAAPT
jgi:hypothetical protein